MSVTILKSSGELLRKWDAPVLMAVMETIGSSAGTVPRETFSVSLPTEGVQREFVLNSSSLWWPPAAVGSRRGHLGPPKYFGEGRPSRSALFVRRMRWGIK
jgi:hypothetical protein